jgi:Mg-chelatase subunit ChlD
MTLSKPCIAIGTALLLAVVACGSAPEPSGFHDRNARGDGDGSNGGTSGGLGGTKSGAGTPDEFQSCATQQAKAEAKPVSLVFMFDKSGSMVHDGSPKWDSAKAASKAFFESAESKGLNASLSFFPSGADGFCEANYSVPKVSMTALPNATFGQTLDDQQVEGGTPTLAALGGAIDYAKQVAEGPGKDGKVAIVLVTDGLPENCGDDSIESVKNLAASVAATTPVYVVGVGELLGNLNEIAAGGGTKSAFIVPDNNPGQIQQDFLKAITAIKNSALSCDYSIPPPPNGESFDRAKVNVVYKPNGAAGETLQYNQSCAGGTGWRYDDANNPTRIVVCDGSCDAIKVKPGQVDILFGCATNGGGVK